MPRDCQECGRDLALEGITDDIRLCHPCYIKLNTRKEEESK